MILLQSLRADPQVAVLSLTGAMNEDELPPVEQDLEELTSASHRPTLLDLSGVTAIDHYGLDFLLKCARRMHTLRSKLMLVAPTAPVEGRLRQANFHTLIPISRDVSHGLELLEIAS
jgi:anti-anti-sigma factor